MDNISYNFIDIKIPGFRSEFFDLWIHEVAKEMNMVLGDLSYVFCNDDFLLEMNKKHLNHNYYTDIISFNYNDKNSLSGEFFISYDRVIDNAKNFSEGIVWDELCRVMIHGLLHLAGFDDKTDQEVKLMRKAEDKCLKLR
jgi:rRNA maturation RNase YbeY